MLKWIYGGKRRVLRGPMVDVETGSPISPSGRPYGEVYYGINRKYKKETGKVLEVHYPDGIVLKRNWIRVLLNPDFKDVKPWRHIKPQ